MALPAPCARRLGLRAEVSGRSNRPKCNARSYSPGREGDSANTVAAGKSGPHVRRVQSSGWRKKRLVRLCRRREDKPRGWRKALLGCFLRKSGDFLLDMMAAYV